MTWEELARLWRETAQRLRDSKPDGHFARAVCGRAYYAAYALVTARLPDGAAFAHGWTNPAHGQLPRLVQQISQLNEGKRREIRTALSRLRQRREDADYRPGITVDLRSAIESLRDMAGIFLILKGDRHD